VNLPIVAYGSPVLRLVAKPIDASYPNLSELLDNMWATMYNSNGVGLAAPQINHSIRLFLIDTVQIVEGAEDDEESESFKSEKPIKGVFINAELVEEDGVLWAYNEGCLSIPKVRADVQRSTKIKLRYQDENFMEHTKEFDGITARVILHEYDHIEGKLFIDRLQPLKRKMLAGKLNNISKGNVSVGYKMMFTQK
jgi:peptide deformylase